MNTGVDDAANLAWKLAAMTQGWGGPELLQSYDVERQPVAFRTRAHRSLDRGIGATPVRPEIGETSEAGEAARRESRRIPERRPAGIRLARRAAWRAL